MARYGVSELRGMVEPDRVHRANATATPRSSSSRWSGSSRPTSGPMSGTNRQVKKPGRLLDTSLIGRQPMIMVRAEDGKVHVLYNRCPHRGNAADLPRSLGQPREEHHLLLSRLAVQFRRLAQGDSARRRATRARSSILSGPPAHEARAARRQLSRLRLREPRMTADPSHLEWMGASRVAFDQMCDRAPDGEVEVVPTCFRILQRSNWKFFLENQLDVAHAVYHARIDRPRRRDVEETGEARQNGARRSTITSSPASRCRSALGTR
jgi:hypothetical protein